MNDVMDKQSTARLGFWLYLMTDIMLFSTLFATFMILRNATNGSVAGRDIFEMPFVLLETMILLVSSLASGIAYAALKAGKLTHFRVALFATLLLGVWFVGLELSEFTKLVHEGYSWQTSAFLSSFFTLVGTHGLHIVVGLVWGSTLAWAIARRKASPALIHKFGLFSLFWHFLDIVWIFIFTIVYIFGVSL
jgi:cytochrome o ubiquinol oxidase subunit 3